MLSVRSFPHDLHRPREGPGRDGGPTFDAMQPETLVRQSSGPPCGDPVSAIEPNLPEDTLPRQPDSSAVSQQILNFLLGLKTLKHEGVTNREELEETLYAKRFELLFPEAEAVAGEKPLPQFHVLPQQQLLKEFLMSGKVLGGHQSVAHVLYPETVQWPHRSDTMAPEESPKADHHAAGEAGAAPSGCYSPQRTSEEITDALVQPSEAEEEKVEVVLCGKRVQSTVRGRALKEVLPQERLLVPQRKQPIQQLPEARFKAAQQTRKQLERQVRLEEYQERRIAERIQSLEIALDDELWHQKELRKKRKRREKRQEELKNDLQSGIEQRIEESRLQREEAQRQEDEEKKEKEKVERYQKAQKEKVEKWQAEMSPKDFQDPHGRCLRRRHQLQREAVRAALAEEERKAEKVPLKRLEVEARLQDLESCHEQRPFVAPRAHDLPRPILQMMEETHQTQSSAGSQAAFPSPRPKGAWRHEAKGVSKRYGLSAEHLRTIEASLQRSAKPHRAERPEPALKEVDSAAKAAPNEASASAQTT